MAEDKKVDFEKLRKGFGVVLERRKQTQGVTTETSDHGTKSKNLANPKQGKIPTFAGEYDILKLTLTSPNRKQKGGYIDLKAAWSDLNIYEDIFASCLTGNIIITDGMGLMENVPIIGEETINIHVKTSGIKREREEITTGPFKGSLSEGIINLKFRVYKISDLIKMNEGMWRYKLHLISEEALINLKSKVAKSALNPATLEPRRISATAKNIYSQYFKRGRSPRDQKKFFIEPTRNLTNLIIPNQTPFKAFNFLASRAVSAGKHAVGSSFVFYETVKGFFFVSMETLMAGGGTGYRSEMGEGDGKELEYSAPENPVKEVYTVQPKKLFAKSDNLKNVAIEMTSVDEYKFESNFDVIKNLQSGMYSNRLLTHDLVRMKYDTLDFNYMHPENTEQLVTEDVDTGGTEVVDVKTMGAEQKNFYDNFTHLGKGRLCSENQFAMGSPESVISFYPTNFGHDVRFPEDIGAEGVHGGARSALNIIPNRVEQWMQSRMVQSQQINNIKLSIRAPGLSTRTVGDLIEFKMPTQYLEDRDGITPAAHHTYLSGYYLITKLRHHFTAEKYEIEFEAIKDALNSPVGGDTASADSPYARSGVT